MTKRDRIQICAHVLRVARDGAHKTRIVYGANLNFKIVRGYLDALQERGLLSHRGRKYHTTERGEQFLADYGRVELFPSPIFGAGGAEA